jgi:histidinol-phosphate aminotransferase
MIGPRYPAHIAALPSTVPFVGPEAQERKIGHSFAARIGANENVFGPSPKAIAAMQTAASDIWKYADPENHDLKAALAARLACSASNVVVGEGIDGLLGYLCRLLISHGDTVVTSDGAYPTFNYHVAGFGGVLHKVAYVDDHEDPQSLMAKAHETGAKIVYLANPDNPMGTWHSGVTIENALDDLPSGCILVLDEAYIEFAPQIAIPDIDPNDPRVIRLRTFSKGYGMAGARVGYGIGAPELITAFDKIRNHFGMNRAAQAGALAALGDNTWLLHVQNQVAEARLRIKAMADDNGLSTLPSATNFVAVDCGRDGAFARAVLAQLNSHGIFVRMPFVAPQDRCIRIGAGTPSDLDFLAEVFPRVLAHANAS